MSEPMTCVADEGTCPCSLVTATGGTCKVFGPPPTFAEAFPYLTTTHPTAGAGLAGNEGGDVRCSCPDPLREVDALCELHGHSPERRYPTTPAETGGGQ